MCDRSLNMGDQIVLLKGAALEIMQIRFNMVFNPHAGTWECGRITYCIDDAVRGEAAKCHRLHMLKGGGGAIPSVHLKHQYSLCFELWFGLHQLLQEMFNSVYLI